MTNTVPFRSTLALALVEIGEAQQVLGNALLALAGPDDPRWRRVANTLDRAAAHVMGHSYDPPNEALKALHTQAPKLLGLAEAALEALDHPAAPLGSWVEELRQLIRQFNTNGHFTGAPKP
jgi:hypothetical protein